MNLNTLEGSLIFNITSYVLRYSPQNIGRKKIINSVTKTKKKERKTYLAERGFDPQTSGLWAQVPLRHSANDRKKNT